MATDLSHLFDTEHPASVYVDIVQPGKAMVIGPKFMATIIANPDRTSQNDRYLIDVIEADDDVLDLGVFGACPSYERGARMVAAQLGLRGAAVKVQKDQEF